MTAVMVDAAFFLKRIQHIHGRMTPTEAARRLQEMAFDHLNDEGFPEWKESLGHPH